jgi:hypothetical protein
MGQFAAIRGASKSVAGTAALDDQLTNFIRLVQLASLDISFLIDHFRMLNQERNCSWVDRAASMRMQH